MFTKFLSNTLIAPGKAPVFDDPKDYGLEYEDVSFRTSDGLNLSGWLIKSNHGNTDKVIIQTHFGIQSSRSGFTLEGKNFMSKMLWDKDVHFLNQAKYLAEAGYTILMYDMRHHGNSDAGTSEWITYGLDERNDVIAAVDFVSTHPSYQNASIGLLSICMGAAATTYAYGMGDELQKNEKIKAMIAIQPLTYDSFLPAMGLPQFMIDRVNTYHREKRNIDLTGDAFLPYAKDIKVPTLLVQNQNDPMTSMDMVKKYFADLSVEKEMLWLDIEKKRGAAYDWVGKSPEPVVGWFDRYMK